MVDSLVVGINYTYETEIPKLYGCVNDAKAVRSLLVALSLNKPDVLLDDKSTLMPNKSQFIRGLVDMLRGPKTRKVLAFSGHGTQVRDTDGDEKDGLDEGLCVTGSDPLITDDELKAIIIGNLRKGDTLTCFFDCCHSKTLLDLTDPQYDGYDILTFSGCTDAGTSADATINNVFQGAFTYCWLRALQMEPKAVPSRLLKLTNQFLRANRYAQKATMCWSKAPVCQVHSKPLVDRLTEHNWGVDKAGARLIPEMINLEQHSAGRPDALN